jgi:hypothetical protein
MGNWYDAQKYSNEYKKLKETSLSRKGDSEKTTLKESSNNQHLQDFFVEDINEPILKKRPATASEWWAITTMYIAKLGFYKYIIWAILVIILFLLNKLL